MDKKTNVIAQTKERFCGRVGQTKAQKRRALGNDEDKRPKMSCIENKAFDLWGRTRGREEKVTKDYH